MRNPPPKSLGRPKGVPNKNTTRVKDAIALLSERNIDKLEDWLDEIAAKDKIEAFKLMLQLLEYNIPKLSRAEVKSEVTNIPAVAIKFVGDESTDSDAVT
jgi:hypothetical protein